ncbi:MAG: tape measure protein [Candidatus Cryptobacteroides sp.]
MANIVEYTLSLNDKLSGKLAKIGITNDRQLAVWGRVQQKVVAANRVLNDCGVSVGSLKGRIDALRAEREWIPASNITAIRRTNSEIAALEGQVRRLEATTGRGLRTAFSNAFSQIPFANLLTNPLVLAGAGGAAAIKKGFEREKTQISFEVLLGNKDTGNSLLKQIQDFGASTPLQTADLQENAKTMLSFGIAADRIMPNLRAIGDIAMGDQQKMNSLTLAFSQMTSTGKLTGQDLLQMINAGFNPLNEISKKTGKSVATLKDEMSKGKISSEMVRDAFISATSAGGQFYGMLDKLGQSKSGRWSTILDRCTQLLWKLYDIIEPVLSPALDGLNKVIDIVGIGLEWLQTAISKVGTAINWWIDKLKAGNPIITVTTILISALVAGMAAYGIKALAVAGWTALVSAAQGIWTAVQWALNSAIWACPITWIVAAIVALIGVIAYVALTTEGWGETWSNTWEWIKLSFQQAGAFLKLTWLKLENTFLTGFETIKTGWHKLQSLWNKDAANEGLAKIESDRNKRAAEIAEAQGKVNELARMRSEIDVWQVKSNGKTLTDVIGGLKKSIGISPAGVPGMTGQQGNGESVSGAGPASQTGAVDAVATGGKRGTTINIKLDNLVGQIVFEDGYEGSRDEMQKDLESALLRVLQMAYTAQ